MSLLLPLLVGCGGFFNSSLDWTALMTCSSNRLVADSDLRWIQFAGTYPQDARPNDLITMSMALTNEAGGNPNAIIGLPSNMRLFLSFDNILDSNDYLVAEYTVNNLDAGQPKILIEEWRIPRPTEAPAAAGFDASGTIPAADAYFPVVIPDPDAASDPNYDPFDSSRPEYIGPVEITYNLIGVLDSANCIDEFDPTGMIREPATREDQRGAVPTLAGYNPATIALNNQVIDNNQVVVQNPNLPNLTVEFRETQPENIPMAGSIIISDWDILNTGVGPVLPGQTFDLTVFFSEDENLDGWDVPIATNTINGPLFAGNQILERTIGSLPYLATRANAYEVEWYSVEDTAGGRGVAPSYVPDPQRWRFKNIPPNVPSWTFTVYCPIPNQNEVPAYLIALVDVQDQIRESVETDNLSDDEEGLNGTVSVREAPPGGGSIDFVAVDTTAFVEDLGVNGRWFTIETNYDYTGFDNKVFSLGFHLSEDDAASSADYFWNRFLFTVPSNGRNRATFTSRMPMANIPAPIDWYVVAVIDDVLAIPEINENNNFCISLGQVLIQ
ncbi:MAG: hypothetical protein AB7K09_18135 [Planctomycetota bacterium]